MIAALIRQSLAQDACPGTEHLDLNGEGQVKDQ